VIHSGDSGLLAEIAAARPLAPLRLCLLAPTVLASAKTRKDDLLEQLVSLTIGGRASYAAMREV
jgi:hypothetical protein